MSRADRLSGMRSALFAAGPSGLTAAKLATRFQVSVRTAKRDMSALRADGWPIRSVLGPGGGYALERASETIPVRLAPTQITALAAVMAAVPNLPFAERARSATRAMLVEAPPDVRDRADRLAWAVRLEPGVPPPSGLAAEDRRALEDALEHRRPAILEVQDDDGRRWRRVVAPHTLILTSDGWRLETRQGGPQGQWSIPLDRIVSARLAEPPPDGPTAQTPPSRGQAPSPASEPSGR